MDLETNVAAHYANPGLEAQILDGLRAQGQDPERINPDVLTAADQLHIGGVEATQAVAAGAGLRAGMQVLDVGCGIGGPARYWAHHLGARVQGVDLTPESVRTAESLTRRCGLDDRVRFSVASALDLPFDDGTFEAATMLHVGMNIADKAGAFREIHRVLKPGGIFALYDIMYLTAGIPRFPLPWAATPASSFLEDRTGYLAALTAASFRLEGERNRHGFAVEFLQRIQDKMSAAAAAPLGMHLHMGTDATVKLGNLSTAVRQGMLAPVELFGRRRD